MGEDSPAGDPAGRNPADGDAPDSGDDDRPVARWPATLRGVTESVVTTRGPEGRWNVAALGLDATGGGDTVGAEDVGAGDGSGEDGVDEQAARVTATTWGQTRTRRNFERRGEGVVQFTDDPVDFVEAALAVREESDPVLDSAAAWARVTVDRVDAGTSDGTEWVQWRLQPVETVRRRATVPTISRGFNALVEATVVASRLDVPAYDTATQEERLHYLLDVVQRCGGPREQAGLERFEDLIDR